MKTRREDLSPKDWDSCHLYLNEINRNGLLAHEPWEPELVAWAADPDRIPRRSTITKLRLGFLNKS